MPEAPESAYLRDYITKNCKGQTLHSVSIKKGRYHKHGPPANFKKFTQALPLKLEAVEKKGKMLILRFEKEWCIISKLGLMGWWYADDDVPQWGTWDPNLEFKFGDIMLYYTDTLSYGTLTFTNNKMIVEEMINKLAPEVEKIRLNELLKRIVDRPRLGQQLLEDVIIDQKALFSGIGNYLKAEVCYDAKIAPQRTVSSLTRDDWKRFLSAAKKVIRVKTNSVSNKDMHKYINTMTIYLKKTDPYGNPVLTHRTKTGRITYWVKEVQK